MGSLEMGWSQTPDAATFCPWHWEYARLFLFSSYLFHVESSISWAEPAKTKIDIAAASVSPRPT